MTTLRRDSVNKGLALEEISSPGHFASATAAAEHNEFELQTIIRQQEEHRQALSRAQSVSVSGATTPRRDDTASIDERGGENDETEILASDLAPVDGGYHALLFLFGSFLLEFTIWGYAYSTGSLLEYHLNNPASPLYGQSSTAISAIGTLVIGVQCFIPLLTRGFSRTFPHLVRSSTLVCIGISVLSLIASSFMTRVGPLLVLQTIYGLSSGTAFTPVILYLNQWWDKRRGLATGIIFAGSGTGGVIFPLAISALLNSVGFGWTMRVFALLTLVLAGGATFCVKPRLPIPTASRYVASQMGWKTLIKQLLPGDLRPMLGRFSGLHTGICFVQSCAWYTISLYISTYCTSLGIRSSTGTAVLSAFNAAAVVGYLIVGPLIDRTSYTAIMVCSQLTCSLASFLLLGFARSLPLVLLFVLLFGMGGGGFTTFMTPVARDIASFSPRQEFATIYLAFVFLRGVASIVGPLIGTALYTEKSAAYDFSVYGTKGFRGIVVYVGSLMLTGALLSIIAAWQRKVDLRKAGDAIRERWRTQ